MANMDHTDVNSSEYNHRETQSRQPPPGAQHLACDPALLAGLECESAMTTGNSDDVLSATSQYPQYVSVDGRSASGASQISPSIDSLHNSFAASRKSVLGDTWETPRANGTSSSSHDRAQASKGARNGSQNSIGTSPASIAEPSASKQGSTSRQDPGLESQLSGAPQTKSEQQRQRSDLEKLSKANLQEMLLRLVESQEHDGGNAGSGSRTYELSQEVARLAQQRSRLLRSQPRRATFGSGSGLQECRYKCGFFGRTCDLNKHVKRHQRPYGCTFPKCHRKFGAKSDWKRHESGQHFQQEAFRCDHPVSGAKCGQHYFRQAQFQKHLQLQHKITSKDVLDDIFERCRIGRNCQGSFWCGFCDAIKILKHKENDAWGERFDHIADHIEKDTPKKNIDDWICVEENLTKKKLLEDLPLGKGDKYADAVSLGVDDRLPATYRGPSVPKTQTYQPPIQGNTLKRRAPADVEESDRAGKQARFATMVWDCVSTVHDLDLSKLTWCT